MKVGDLGEVVKSDSHAFNIEGKRGLITELIDYTRYSTAFPEPVPSAIVLFTTGTMILPLSALAKVEDTYV